MRLPEIGHVGYIVDDTDAAARRFIELYGIEKHVIYDFIPTRSWAWGREINRLRLRIAQLIPERGPKLELIQQIEGGDTPFSRFIACGSNIHHTAYYVDDYPSWRAWLEAQPGARVIFEAEACDGVMGCRTSCYFEFGGLPGVLELSMRTRV